MTNAMKNTQQLFVHYTTVWTRLLQQAAGSPDPATYLLEHDARTPLFYLEGMSRVLMSAQKDKKMASLNAQFKALEDGLGVMDYYAGLLKDFKQIKQLTEFQQNLETHRTIASAQMNSLLEHYGWLENFDTTATDGAQAQSDRLKKIQKMYKKIDWLSDKKMRKALKQHYKDALSELKQQIKRPLKEVERDMHELRRDVRWLSIYPQAFKGFINLAPSEPMPESFAKYATDDIVKSPFNQLPQVEGMTHILYLNTHAYYAMSWLIAELGALKDQGLRLLALTDGLIEHKKLSSSQANQAAVMIIGNDQLGVDKLLAKAQEIANQIRQDKVFSQLLA